MPRPKNANLSTVLFAKDAAFSSHPGEAYDEQPNKVEPSGGAEGWLPGQRPPAENFNWQANRWEKLLRYLDTIDVRNFVPPVTVADIHAKGIDWEGSRYVVAGDDGSGPSAAKCLTGTNGWDYDSNESAQLAADVEYDDNPWDLVCSGRRTYLFTDGALQIREDFNSYVLHQVSETFGGVFYTHRGLIGQAWKDPEIANTVWVAWLSQKSPAGASDWISIGRCTTTGHTWTTGVNAGTGRVGLNTGHLQDPGDPRVDRAMFADLDGKRVCVCNGPSMTGNQLLISTDVANDFLQWSAAGALAGITGTIVGLERSGDFLIAVTAEGRCYRSSDASTWTLISFPLGVATMRMTFLDEFSPAMIKHGSVLLAVGELSTISYGSGGEGVVIVASVDHGETWEVVAGWPHASYSFMRIRSMQDGRVACVGAGSGTTSQIAYSLRTKSLPVGDDES